MPPWGYDLEHDLILQEERIAKEGRSFGVGVDGRVKLQIVHAGGNVIFYLYADCGSAR